MKDGEIGVDGIRNLGVVCLDSEGWRMIEVLRGGGGGGVTQFGGGLTYVSSYCVNFFKVCCFYVLFDGMPLSALSYFLHFFSLVINLLCVCKV